MLRNPIQRNHDANNTGGGNNAGTDVSDLLDASDLLDKPASAAPSQEPAKVDKKADDNNGTEGTKTTTPAATTKAAEPAAKKDDTEPVKKVDEPKAVTVDDVTYQLNDKGDAVDKDGNIVKTKEELNELERQQDQDNEIPLTEEILQKSGYKILDEQGKPKSYEDTPEGLLELTNDLAVQKANQEVKKFFSKYPAVVDFAKHLERGGTKEEYFKVQAGSWRNIKFDEKDETQLTNAIVTELVSKGVPREQAEFTAKNYKDTDKLKDFGKAAYQRLVKSEEDADAAKDAQDQKAIQEYNQRQEAHWKNVQGIVSKGKLNNITIPETDREKFYNYVAIAANEQGQSQVEIDATKLPIEQQLELDYFVFKGGDLGKLIANAIKTDKARSLRDRTKSGQSGLGGGEGVDKSQFTKTKDADISLDTIL